MQKFLREGSLSHSPVFNSTFTCKGSLPPSISLSMAGTHAKCFLRRILAHFGYPPGLPEAAIFSACSYIWPAHSGVCLAPRFGYSPQGRHEHPYSSSETGVSEWWHMRCHPSPKHHKGEDSSVVQTQALLVLPKRAHSPAGESPRFHMAHR